MGSLSRVWSQAWGIWQTASHRQRALVAVGALALCAAVAALSVSHVGRPSEGSIGNPPRTAATHRAEAPKAEPAEGSRDLSLMFRPYSSLQSGATRDLEQRLSTAIASFRDVERTRVLVQPAHESAFGESGAAASALVIVGVREGGRLTTQVVRAIAECVTVSGAPLERIRVTSETGVALFGNGSVLVTDFAQRGVPPAGRPTSRSGEPAMSASASSGALQPHWALAVGTAAGIAVGLCGGVALVRRRGRDSAHVEQPEVMTLARTGSTVVSSRPSSPFAGRTADEVLSLLAGERPAVVARVLERIDRDVSEAVVQALPEQQRVAVVRVSQDARPPWRRSRAALERAVLAKRLLPPHGEAGSTGGGAAIGGEFARASA